MSILIERHALLLEQLYSSIYLLKLLTERSINLDELVLDYKEVFLKKSTFDNANNREDYSEEDLKDIEIISAEDIKERNFKALRDKVFDRLIKTLTRYKSDYIINKGFILDLKYIFNTMMIINEEYNKVKILYIKNKRLNQYNSTDDIDFLSF